MFLEKLEKIVGCLRRAAREKVSDLDLGWG
jgi:hypothetical protein